MKIFIQNFYEVMNGLKIKEGIIVDIDTDAEVKSGIATINNLEVSELHKVCVFGIPHSHNFRITIRSVTVTKFTCMNFLNKLLLLFIIKVHVPFSKSSLASPILNHHEPDHLDTVFRTENKHS